MAFFFVFSDNDILNYMLIMISGIRKEAFLSCSEFYKNIFFYKKQFLFEIYYGTCSI